jgi:hypothetical protein
VAASRNNKEPILNESDFQGFEDVSKEIQKENQKAS